MNFGLLWWIWFQLNLIQKNGTELIWSEVNDLIVGTKQHSGVSGTQNVLGLLVED